jgi:hypothetical protein
MNEISIRDIDGKILYRGTAESRKKLIASLVAKGASLARADLRNADMSYMDLNGIDLEGAMLETTDFRGSQMKGAHLEKASLRRAKFAGAMMQGVQGQAADFTGADLHGAILTFSNLRGAILDGADLTAAGCSSAVMTHCSMNGTRFREARLHSTDFGSSRIVKADFSGANMKVTGPLNWKHFADRTRNATVVGCIYDDNTRFCESAPEFRRDYRINRFAKAALWTTSSLAILGLGLLAPGWLDEGMLANLVTPGAGFIAVFAIAFLLKEKLEDVFKEHAESRLHSWQVKLRDIAHEIARKGGDIASLVAATGRSRTLEPIRTALATTSGAARKRGFFSAFREVMTTLGDVVICDRRHLAMALASISANRDRRYGIRNDVILMRFGADGKPPTGTAACLKFHRDGRTTAVWCDEQGAPARSATWGTDGTPEHVEGLLYELSPCKGEVLGEFEAALLAENGMPTFRYPRSTNYIQAGQDGSILVFRSANKRLDNPDGPAFIGPDGTRRHFRNGSPSVRTGQSCGPDAGGKCLFPADPADELPAPGPAGVPGM